MYCKLERQRGEEIVLQYRLVGGWIVLQYKNCIVTEAGQCCIAIQSLGHDTALGRVLGAQAGVRGVRRWATGEAQACRRARAHAGIAGVRGRWSAGGRASGAQARWAWAASGARGAGRRTGRAAGRRWARGGLAAWARGLARTVHSVHST